MEKTSVLFDQRSPSSDVPSQQKSVENVSKWCLLFRWVSVGVNLLLLIQICILLSQIWDLPRFFSNLSSLPQEVHGDLRTLPMFGKLNTTVFKCCGLSAIAFCISFVRQSSRCRQGGQHGSTDV